MSTEKTDLIIDKNYPGLVDIGWAYEFNGSLASVGNIVINLKKWLKVTGGIKAGSSIRAGEGIIYGLWIKCKKIHFN